MKLFKLRNILLLKINNDKSHRRRPHVKKSTKACMGRDKPNHGEPSRAEPSHAEPCRAELSRAVLSRAVLSRAEARCRVEESSRANASRDPLGKISLFL